jgi:hypothetical protein
MTTSEKEGCMPRYMVLIYGDEARWETQTDEEREASMARYMALADRPEVVGGAELQPVSAATSVRVRDGERLVTDGPYAELKEALGGYYLVECGSIDEAVEFAALIPAAEHGAIEVRPAYVDADAEQQAEQAEVTA